MLSVLVLLLHKILKQDKRIANNRICTIVESVFWKYFSLSIPTKKWNTLYLKYFNLTAESNFASLARSRIYSIT